MQIGCKTLMNSEGNKVQTTQCNVQDLTCVYLTLVLPACAQFMTVLQPCGARSSLFGFSIPLFLMPRGSHRACTVPPSSSFPEFTSGVSSLEPFPTSPQCGQSGPSPACFRISTVPWAWMTPLEHVLLIWLTLSLNLLIFLPSALLGYFWHTTLCKFKVHSMIWYIVYTL